MNTREKRTLIIAAGNACERAIHELGFRTYLQIFELVHDMDEWHALMSHDALEHVFANHHFGRSFEYLRSVAEFNAPMAIEVVKNENPCHGFLCMPVPAPLLVLSQAHALAHNNFFCVNRWMYQARPATITDSLKEDARALEHIRSSIGRDKVTEFLDACRYIMWHKDRMPRIECIGEDLLRFFLHHANLSAWQQKVMQIVIRLSDYLYAIRMTKLANEGYAAYLQWPILERAFTHLKASRELIQQCGRSHREIIAPPSIEEITSAPSPYWVGYIVWKHLAKPYASLSELEWLAATIDDDSITHDLLHHDMLNEIEETIRRRAEQKNVQADFLNHEWIKNILRISFGSDAIPRICVADIRADSGARDLYLHHEFPDSIRGVEINTQYAQHCLTVIESQLWKHGRVYLISKKANGAAQTLHSIR